MKVLFLTNYYSEGPSSRYRSFNYEKYFKNANITVNYRPLFREGYIKKLYSGEKNSTFDKIIDILKRIIYIIFNKEKYDHIIIETEIVKFLPYFVEKILLRNVSYSLDFDDNPKSGYLKNKIIKFFYENKINKLCENAAFVTVGNKWYFEDLPAKNLIYLPTVIDLDKYKKIKEINHNEKIKEIVIVWIGSKSTQNYIEIIKNPIKKLSKKYPLKLNIIGGELKLEEVVTELIKWDEKTEAEEILKGDIGIMPLYDTYFEKGKCGFKLIQYMASGLPVIGSPAPANKEIITHGEDGYIAKNEEEWYLYLEKLIISEDLRRKMGINARRKIEKYYSYQVWQEKYVEIIKNGFS